MKNSRRPKGVRLPLATALAALIVAAPSTDAATRTWDGNGNNANWGFVDLNLSSLGNTNWTDASFFTPLPINGDSLIFQGSNRLTNSNDLAGLILTGISFQTGAGAFTLNGNAVTNLGNIVNSSSQKQTINLPITLGADQLWAGNSDTAKLSFSGTLDLANHALSLKDAEIINSSGVFIVGNSASATLSLSDGATVSVPSATLGKSSGVTGTLSVEGTGAAWAVSNNFQIGESGTGSLTLKNGTVSDVNGILAANAGSTGTASVDGSHASWTQTNDMRVGQSGNGSLTIQHGGSVSGKYGYVGVFDGSNGTATVDGTGSSWSTTNTLFVGYYGIGNLTVSNKGKLNDFSSIVGYLAGSSGSVTVTGSDSVWTGGGDHIIGGSGTGSLTLLQGGVASNLNGILGANSDGSGTVLVDGPGSSWNNSADLYVGFAGFGSLTLSHGGLVNDSNGRIGYRNGVTGTVLVDGTGSSWISGNTLFVGDSGTGNLTVSNGGTVSDFASYVGNISGSSGSVTVSGAGSTWTGSGYHIIGEYGSGSLSVSQGGVVNDVNGILGNNQVGSGAAVVDGAGSSWNNSAGLFVGVTGTGSLTISNGGTVSANQGIVGHSVGSKGVTVVDGAGSELSIQSTLNVGLGGTGSLTIQNGGKVSVNGTVGVGSLGHLTLNGGSLSMSSGLLSSGGIFDWLLGTVNLPTLNLGGTDNLFGETLTLDANHILNITGNTTVAQNGILNVAGGNFTPGGAFNNDGILSVSASATVNPVGLFSNTGTVVDRGTLQATTLNNSGSIQLAGTGKIVTTQLNLQGGSISGTALSMNSIGSLSGFGSVSSAINGGSGVIQANGGALSLGNLNSNTGFDFGGHLEVGSNQVVLLDKNEAQLGIATTIADGGKLASVNGINLSTGETLAYSGNASIQGGFTNNGQISGTGSLVFLNAVNGGGGFGGDIFYQASYSPGNSPASVDYHNGDVHFDTNATLNMEIFGTTAGTEYDQLTGIHLLDFNGSLNLIFGSGFTPVTGDSFSLFNFALFSGAFDPVKINVTGFDASRLDFSQLGINGNLKVIAAPVPLPSAVWLFGSTLAALAVRGRRQRTV